jgi:hypothetical protein
LVRPARGPDGTIYAIDVGFRLYAVAPDGALKWIARGAGNKGVAVAPDGTIYTGSESDVKAYRPDGTMKWVFVQNPRAFILIDLEVGPDGNIYGVATSGLGVFSLTPDGTLRWTNPETYARPIVDYADITFGPNGSHHQLYFTANNHTRAVRLDNGESVFTIPPIGRPAVSPIDATIHARASAYLPSGQFLWRFVFPLEGVPVTAAEIGSDGTHYVTYRSSELYALAPDGREKWHLFLAWYVGAPNIDPTNSIAVVGSSGTLNFGGFILGVSTSARKQVWRLDLPPEEPGVYNPWTGLYGFNQYVDTPATFSVDGQTAYLVTAIATGGLVTDRCFLTSIAIGTSTPPPPPPSTIVMRVTRISLAAKAQRNGPVNITGAVSVETSNAAPVSGARVQVTWEMPGSALLPHSALTDATGTATFSVAAGRGTYTVTITSVTKEGYTYDPTTSVTTRSVTK